MSQFIPLPPECDLSHIEQVNLPKEKEAFMNAYLEYEDGKEYVRSLKEWSISSNNRLQRRNIKRMLHEHEIKLIQAKLKLENAKKHLSEEERKHVDSVTLSCSLA